MFPLKRNRRLRTNAVIRSLVRENTIMPNDFLVPLFVVEGKGIKEPIVSMPDYFRCSLDILAKEVKELWEMGLRAVLIFVKIAEELKDNKATEALNKKGLMQRAVQTIKNACPDMIVMTDVALDPFSSYGHDGIVVNGKIINDDTVTLLAEMSIVHAEAGADFVAPSDMMDGRVINIRQALEEEGYVDTGIMSYSAKYASAFYGPFRDALNSAPSFGDKKTYQMDVANKMEALHETKMDIKEGADIVMVKPGMPYLDVLCEIKNKFKVPVAVYQVSGEYAMLKAAIEKGWLNSDQVILESIMAFKRAGADIIASYFAKDVVRLLG